MQDRKITVWNAAIRYVEAGAGEPFLLLPSSAGRANEYRDVIPLLSNSFHVYTLDYPGFGQSDSLPSIEGTEDLADFILAWMGAIGLRECHLAGFSMGGWIALRLV